MFKLLILLVATVGITIAIKGSDEMIQGCGGFVVLLCLLAYGLYRCFSEKERK